MRITTMQIKEITYERINNLGNYENERIAATAQLEPGEDPEEKIIELKYFVEKSLFDRPEVYKK